jgi:hypothetical protein
LIPLATAVLAAACSSCGDNRGPAPDAAPQEDPRRGPTTVTLTGSANALTWDAATSTLLLTDNTSNSLIAWSDADGARTISPFPPQSAGSSLGALVKLADGTVLAANFGFGTQGSILSIDAARRAGTLGGLDPARRRIGLSLDAHGALYTCYFTGGGGMSQTGGVAKVEIDGATSSATEIEIAGSTTGAGFKKVVGLVATPAAVFVSDQTQKKIFKISVPGYAVTPLATVPNADLLALLPDGDLLTGGGPEILRVTQTGEVSTLFSGFEQVRGLAYDPTLKRLFFIEHSLTVGTPDKLQIRPLDL